MPADKDDSKDINAQVKALAKAAGVKHGDVVRIEVLQDSVRFEVSGKDIDPMTNALAVEVIEVPRS